MKLISSFINRLTILKNWFFKLSFIKKTIIFLIIIAAGWFGLSKLNSNKSQQPIYQTTQVEKGTLVVSISASGQVSAANSGEVKTSAAGVVKKIYVKNDQVVKSGDKIADIDLDQTAKQKYTQALSSYQSAKNALASAQANLYTTQSDMFTNWQKYMDKAQNATYQNADKTPNTSQRNQTDFQITDDNWLATEAKYKIQQATVTQTQTALSSAWMSLQQLSPTIVAPISGKVTGLSLQIGSVLTSQQSSSGTDTAQKIASVQTDAVPTITVNLTEVDIPKVEVGNKATVTFSAFPDKTFTGQVVSIDTVGSVSSGVTTYPAVIKLDTQVEKMLANMSADANIITQTVNDALLAPASAIQTKNGVSTAKILKNGQVESVTVKIGESNTSQVVINSGLSEGDNVVTSTTQTKTSTAKTNTTTSSPFSAFGVRTGGGGGPR